MSRYAAGGRSTAANTAAVGDPLALLWNPSASVSIFLREFRYARTVATAGGPLALARVTARGSSPGATVTPDIDSDFEKALAPPSGALIDLGLWSGTFPNAGLNTLTCTDRGTGSDKTSGTTYVFSPASNFAANSLAVAVFAVDNSGVGGAGAVTGVTDSLGHTWTDRGQTTNDPGLVNEGAHQATFDAPMGASPLTTGDTITLTFSTATVAKAYALIQIAALSGTPVAINEASGTGSGTGVTRSGITPAIGDVVIGSVFTEGVGSITGDADTTGGAWSTIQTSATAGGLATTNMAIGSQWKVVTTADGQSIDFTLGASQDWVAQLAQWRAPTAAVKALDRCQTASVIGHGPNGWIYEAPGIRIPPGTGLVVVNAEAQITRVGDVTFVWDEGSVDDDPMNQPVFA